MQDLLHLRARFNRRAYVELEGDTSSQLNVSWAIYGASRKAKGARIVGLQVRNIKRILVERVQESPFNQKAYLSWKVNFLIRLRSLLKYAGVRTSLVVRGSPVPKLYG